MVAASDVSKLVSSYRIFLTVELPHREKYRPPQGGTLRVESQSLKAEVPATMGSQMLLAKVARRTRGVKRSILRCSRTALRRAVVPTGVSSIHGVPNLIVLCSQSHFAFFQVKRRQPHHGGLFNV